jgi:hypothetical protein
MTVEHLWLPPDFTRPESGRLGKINTIFSELYPSEEYGDLAEKISRYWISKLEEIWAQKTESIKVLDRRYNPQDPLARIEQKTVLIAYADSIRKKGKFSLIALQDFLNSYFPAVRGLHMLPACEISEKRFNDGGFSQIRRDRIHATYGTNAQFEAMMEKFFSMADFVLNHVDIENPYFQKYLKGNDLAGKCFFVFSEAEYQKRLAQGDFEQVFRPRPFPLFTVFRRKPREVYASLSHDQRISALNRHFQENGLAGLSEEVLNILVIFNKIKNDQMLLDQDYQCITQFQAYLESNCTLDPEELFVVSETQETQNIPYIFNTDIQSLQGFLLKVLPPMKISVDQANRYGEIFEANETEIFGEPIRVLTTFSHVQVDLNTATYERLKLLIDDFSSYLKMDLNMLRLDAANFAFKKWGTSCFGLPKVRKLLKILYLSMESVSPRNVPNLEVNAPLGNILKQMSDKQAPPPMMYDFHLASMLPIVFNMSDTRPLLEIFKLIRKNDIPHESIRFSLDESHDGKSVSGSGGADPLLTYKQRSALIDIVKKNGGYVKYKSSPKHRFPPDEFKKVCMESGLDFESAAKLLFKKKSGETEPLRLKEEIQTQIDIAQALNIAENRLESDAALNFFAEKILNGRDPYELCIATRDALKKLADPFLEVKRYMAFKTLALALMGRHVKSMFINDLIGLLNNPELVEKTGELRNIKRTKSDRKTMEKLISDPSRLEYWIAKQMNNLIALVDSDPSFHPRGNEARVAVDAKIPAVALVHNFFEDHHTLVIVNTSEKAERVPIHLPDYGLDHSRDLIDNITAVPVSRNSGGKKITLETKPFDRYWIKNKAVAIDQGLRVDAGTEADMYAALKNRPG